VGLIKTSFTLAAVATLVFSACGDDSGDSTQVPPTTNRATTTTEGAVETVLSPTTSTPAVAPTTTATSPSTSPPSSTTSVEPTPETETTMPDPLPDEIADSSLVQSAIADLRTRLDDPTAEITIVSVEEVDWPDGSIGCPQPGMVYTQAVINGTKIVLSYDGINYDYHQGGSRDVFYCSPGAVTK